MIKVKVNASKSSSRTVTIVYRTFSTKNQEQVGPIKRLWEISDKYYPEALMTSAFGWDWTGYETEFKYGIILNDNEVIPEFIEELEREFPDIILNTQFSIPTTYDAVYECTLEESNAVYDEIWDKGFLRCELEEYPALGHMIISVIYK